MASTSLPSRSTHRNPSRGSTACFLSFSIWAYIVDRRASGVYVFPTSQDYRDAIFQAMGYASRPANVSIETAMDINWPTEDGALVPSFRQVTELDPPAPVPFMPVLKPAMRKRKASSQDSGESVATPASNKRQRVSFKDQLPGRPPPTGRIPTLLVVLCL